MKIFILCNKATDDYSTLPKEASQFFLYRVMPSRITQDLIQKTTSELRKEFEKANPETDAFVPNGPSWLISIASDLWFNEVNGRMFVYDNSVKSYVQLEYIAP